MNNAEFFEALKLLEKEKGITGDYLLEKIRAAIIIAVKRDFGGKENIAVIMDPATNEFSVSLFKRIVEEVEDPDEEMLPEEAAKYTKKPLVGETVEIKLETKQFGRIAAQTAKHVIRQGIREAERGQQMQEFQRRNQELVTALVTRVDPKTGAATLEIGKAETVLPKSEQIGEWKCPKFSTASWKSRRFPARPAPAPSWPSWPMTKTWTRWAPASAPAAPVWAAL